jgi:hypothetical protein
MDKIPAKHNMLVDAQVLQDCHDNHHRPGPEILERNPLARLCRSHASRYKHKKHASIFPVRQLQILQDV